MKENRMNTKTERKMETPEELAELVAGLDGPVRIEVRKLSSEGDERLAWDPTDLDQLKEARDKFYDLIDKGHVAFAVDPRSGEANKGRKLVRFDPNAGEIVFTFRDVLKYAKSGRKVVARPAVTGG